jgi:hypothetical protein
MGNPKIGIGHVARCLFMPHRQRLDLILTIVESIEEPDNPVAAKAEYVRNLLLHEIFGNDVSPPHPYHDTPPHSG